MQATSTRCGVSVVKTGGVVLAAGLLFGGVESFAGPLFGPAIHFPAGAAPREVAIGDLDGDQVPDLVVTNFNSDICVLMGAAMRCLPLR